MSSSRYVGTSVTEVQRRFYNSPGQKWLMRLFWLIMTLGILALLFAGYVLYRVNYNFSQEYSDIDLHFKYGSIGSEQSSGIPIKILKALPVAFPEHFGGREDYSEFGFLYEESAPKPDLPVGFSSGERLGVEVAWINCAACHVGQIKVGDNQPRLVSGMPSNTVRLHEFFMALFDMAASKKFNPDELIPKIEEANGWLWPIERQLFRYLVIPQVRQELIDRKSRLERVFGEQPNWGPGRVDTFSGYKMIHFDYAYSDLTDAEKIGAADFPAIFLQGPKGDLEMDLHWDGNNKSLQERNLSAALGAGVTEETVLHHSIERVANWLRDLEPPKSLIKQDVALAERGREIYKQYCLDCHGEQTEGGYQFTGSKIGKVTPLDELGTDEWRLNSYTERLAKEQKQLFASDQRYKFEHFRKTNGYANMPLDGLWLRAPYLHNGSVPTLYDLLLPSAERPQSFVRGLVDIDMEKGGFVAPLGCLPGEKIEAGFCFSTIDENGDPIPGNYNGGHEYATNLTEDEKASLLEYLKGF